MSEANKAPEASTGLSLTAAELDAIDALRREASPVPIAWHSTRGGSPQNPRAFSFHPVGVKRWPPGKMLKDARLLDALWNHSEGILALARTGLEAGGDAIGKCEGCSKPATLSDEEGVPLCEACYCGLVVEEYRSLAQKHEESGIHVVLARAACEAAESKLAAALAECELVKARLEKALLAIRLGFHAERFVVGDEGVTRYSCCGKEYVCADPFVNDHEKDCKAVQLANAAEAQAATTGAKTEARG